MPSAGSLDPSFGTNGIAINNFATFDLSVNTIIQPDGKILNAGVIFDNDFGISGIAVTRHNPDGSLDSSFGNLDNDGFAAVEQTELTIGYYQILLAGDGSITVQFNYINDVFGDILGFGLVRFTPDGIPDLSFGDNGVLLFPYISQDPDSLDFERAYSLIQPDGKIIAVNKFFDDSDLDFSLVRIDENGNLDNSFGNGGLVITDFDFEDRISNIILQPDGKLLVYGVAEGLSSQFIIIRYNSDGSIDNNFGNNGIIAQDKVSNLGEVLYERVFLQPDDKIIAFDVLAQSTIIQRYNSNGSIDNNFGNNGSVFIDSNVFLSGIQASFEPDGQILILAGTASDLTLFRYNSDGSIDASFGNNGTVVIDVGSNDAIGIYDSYDAPYGTYAFYGGSLHLDEQGRILVSGYSDFLDPDETYFVTRYLSDGSLDTSFGENGIIQTSLFKNTNNILTTTFSLQPDGNILLSGSTQTDPNNPDSLDFIMLSYLAEYANAAPQNLVLQAGMPSTNQLPYLLSGSFNDLGENDVHAVLIEWGDGSTTDLNLTAGDSEFADIEHIYTDPGSYTINVQVTDPEGLTTSAIQQIEIGNSKIPDFNRDELPDIVWRNQSTGQNSIWYLDGNNTRLEGEAIQAVSNINWCIEAIGDFDGDGQDDLLWRNGVNGKNTVWLMDERTRESTSPIDSVSNTNWQIQGVGTFEAGSNLRNDIVWRNQDTGANVIWVMEGTNRVGTIDIQDVNNPNWEITGVGDFDGDGRLNELVWRNYETGKNVVWSVNPDGTRQTQSLSSLSNSNWRIEGVSDFDGDGFADDLLWRNSTLGRTSAWFIDNGVQTGTAAITPTVPGGSWTPVV